MALDLKKPRNLEDYDNEFSRKKIASEATKPLPKSDVETIAILASEDLARLIQASRNGISKEYKDFLTSIITITPEDIMKVRNEYKPRTGHQAILEQLKRAGVKPTLYMSAI